MPEHPDFAARPEAVPALHAAAVTGFTRMAKEYERGRPAYPREAVAAVLGALGRPGRVLDLAAGTGKLTRLLVEAGVEVVAVEPLGAMRAELVAALPDVEALAGSAESIPLAAGSVDAVLVAQAFHWFDPPRALAEIHRVLRPGGGLGLLWNIWDDSSGWLAQVSARVEAVTGFVPQFRHGAWRPAVEASPLLGPLHEQSFGYTHVTDHAAFVERVASISFVGSLPDAERAAFLAEIAALVPRRAPLRVRYRTYAYTARRVDGA
jgi:SAM-dependent methyltransferase